jgi:transcriptional antiterminator RfaH
MEHALATSLPSTDATSSREDEALSGSWYLVHCIARKEAFAAYVLTSHLGLQVYLPQVTRHVRGSVQQTPFFPGYLFVQADLGQVTRSIINSAPGVVRLLDFGGGPQLVPLPVLRDIRARLDKLNGTGGLPTHNFKSGEAVRVKSGPLRGVEALFVGPLTPSARVTILLDMLGRLNEVKVDVETLEHAPNVTIARQGRTTRGKGRRINGV